MDLTSYVPPHSCVYCESLILTPPDHDPGISRRKQLLSKLSRGRLTKSTREQLLSRLSRGRLLDPELIPTVRRMFLFEFEYDRDYEDCAFFAFVEHGLDQIAQMGGPMLSWPEFAEQFNREPPGSTGQVVGVLFEPDGIHFGVISSVLQVEDVEPENAPEEGWYEVEQRMVPDPSNKQRFESFTSVPFGIFAKSGDLAYEQFETLASTNLRSEAWFTAMRATFRECLDNHARCAPTVGAFCPTRLLAILKTEDGSAIRLKENCGPGTSYVALSYCWGGPQEVRTTKETLARHLTNIDPTKLPATLRDALEVTERMGLQYLWVDALCIVQDDDEDKGREIGAMGRIYECATLTIRASRARAVFEGFLHDLKPYGGKAHGDVFCMGYRASASGEVDSIVLTPKMDFTSRRLEKDRLATRAWAFQEQHLSKRMVDFGSTCVHYQCREGFLCDRKAGRCKPQSPQSGADVFKDKALVMGDPRTLRARFSESFQVHFDTTLLPSPRRLHDSNQGELDVSAFQNTLTIEPTLSIDSWYKTVNAFSDKQLTFASDRLPAVAGIAERHNKTIKDEYLAGVWRSNIPYGLLWRVDNVTDEFRDDSAPNPAAPTWSWASTMSPVFTNYYTGHAAYRRVKAELLKADMQYQMAGAKYGATASGYLTLRGPVRPAHWKLPQPPGDWWENPDALEEDTAAGPSEVDSDNGEDGHIFKPDAALDDDPLSLVLSPDDTHDDVLVGDGRTVRVFLLVLVTDVNELSAVGLILHQNAGGRYVRLGVFDTLRGFLDEYGNARQWAEVACRDKNLRTARWLLKGDVEEVTIG